jgi:hypothetical protein
LDNRNKSSYLCSPNRKENGFSPSFLIILSLSQESLRNEFKKKKQKNFRKSLVVKIKPLTFAPAFETKATSSLKY